MRSKLSLLTVSAALALVSHAAIDAGNGVKIVPNLILGADFNDNLYLTPVNQQDNTLYKASPGILISSGDGALNTTTFSYNEEFQFYSSDSDLDTALALVDLTSSYDDGKMKIDLNAYFHQANQAQRDVRSIASLIKRDIIHGGVSDEVKWSEKTSAKLGIAYDDTDYKPAGYADWKWVEVPVQYFYAIQPKLDVSLGFRYKKNEVSGLGVDSDEYFYNVGVRGELTPKLTGEIQVGYNQLKPDTGSSEDSLGLKANLTFAVSQKTSLGLDALDEFGYSSSGSPFKNVGASVRFDTAISPAFHMKGNVFWYNYDYLSTGRSDDYYGGQLSGAYTFNEHAEVSASYTYSKNDSNLSALSYDNNIVSLSATFKY